MLDNRTKLQDLLSVLQDSNATIGGLLTNALTIGQHGTAVPPGSAVGTAATAVSFNTGGGFTEGKLVIDIRMPGNNAAAGIGTSGEVLVPADNQKCRITLQGSTTVGFATIQELAGMLWGINDANAGVTVGLFGDGQATPDITNATRYIIPWNNMYGTKVYQFLRVFSQYRGTWATGLAFTAWLTK